MMKKEEIIGSSKSAFYVFDVIELKRRIDYLRSSLPDGISLCYAMKANTFVLKEISDIIEKIEICSPGEEDICNALHISDKKMVISGIYKSPDFIEKLVSNDKFSGIYTVESKTQYHMFCNLSKKYNREISVLLRLTNDSQFGINKSDIEDIIRSADRNEKVRCIGIQYFSGTQKTSLKRIKRELDCLDGFLTHLKDDLGFCAKHFEYGPGFPVFYFEEENFDESAFLEGFSQLIDEMSFKCDITLEIGRSIAASCGKYYTHIVDIKQNNGMNYAIVDGGMNHIQYFGQQMAMKHPKLSVLGHTYESNNKPWNICGSLCSMNDILVKQMPLPDIKIGDTICFENAGAYCMTEGISLFLSRDIPAIYLALENGNLICVRETFETACLNTPKQERI